MLELKELPQEIDKEEEKTPVIDTDVKQFLTENITGPEKSKLKIVNLWGNVYRLNFWGKKTINIVKGKDDAIIYSVFVILKKTDDSFEITYQADN